ncbi:hypothetical protein N7492_008959 [Penicillium capsulatum]|uniref:Uncharacterized protein n=1 Tax=Penicillium capsulatum TaxID=69766 RepID=A0A9W9HUI2_9EURO|nr:hypothetical protein N7492_008959 [Penicillium capsulatum]KAJ6106360.1 hypothetical protein N7512_009877 [Penicillium capsulatum]
MHLSRLLLLCAIALGHAFPSPSNNQHTNHNPSWSAVSDAPSRPSKPFIKGAGVAIYYDGFTQNSSTVQTLESALATVKETTAHILWKGLDPSFLTWFSRSARNPVEEIHHTILNHLVPRHSSSSRPPIRRIWVTSQDWMNRCAQNQSAYTGFKKNDSMYQSLRSAQFIKRGDCVIHVCDAAIRDLVTAEMNFSPEDIPQDRKVQESMVSLWSVLFRELIHCPSIGNFVMHGFHEKPILWQDEETHGALNSSQVAKSQPGRALRNPSNYQWHAVNRYWNLKLPWNLRPPGPDQPPNLDSPRGDQNPLGIPAKYRTEI